MVGFTAKLLKKGLIIIIIIIVVVNLLDFKLNWYLEFIASHNHLKILRN